MVTSEQPSAQRHVLIGREEHDGPVAVGKAKRQHFGHDFANLARRKVDNGGDHPPHQRLGRVMFSDLGGRRLNANCGAKVDR